MKKGFKAFLHFLSDYYFIAVAYVALFLPDILLRHLIDKHLFEDAYIPRVTYGFSALWIVIILFFCIFVLPKKAGRIAYLVANGTLTVLAFCQYVYFGIFGQFFWLKSIALAGEGADYLGFALKYIDLRLIVCTLLSILLMVFAAIRWHSPKKPCRIRWLFMILPIAGLFVLHIYMLPQTHAESEDDWDSWSKPRVVYKQRSNINNSFAVNGFYQLTLRDLYNTCFAPSKYQKEDFAKVEEFFKAQGDPVPNDYTGIFKGKNVIAVMLEGIDTWMIDRRYTPTMCYMMDHGLNFTNYYSPTFGTGHTFNAEFAFNTGYFSPLSAISATSFGSNYFPYSMANLFKSQGYSTNSFHYNTPEFYNRGVMHKNLGYQAYNSFPDFGMPITVSQSDSNILKNEAIYQKMTESQPFFDFVITYSGHVPYTFNDAKLALAKENHPELIDYSMNSEKNNCLILAADTDDFFRQLLERLDRDGLLDNTVIVAFTDHYAYGFSDQEKLAGYKNGEIMYRVPAFIYARGLEGKKISKPSQTIDMLPTIVNLFDIKADTGFLGKDIMSPDNPGFAYFGNAAWLDDKMYYDPSGADTKPDQAVREHIQKQNKRVKESFEITEIVVSGDYFSHK